MQVRFRGVIDVHHDAVVQDLHGRARFTAVRHDRSTAVEQADRRPRVIAQFQHPTDVVDVVARRKRGADRRHQQPDPIVGRMGGHRCHQEVERESGVGRRVGIAGGRRAVHQVRQHTPQPQTQCHFITRLALGSDEGAGLVRWRGQGLVRLVSLRTQRNGVVTRQEAVWRIATSSARARLSCSSTNLM